MATTPATLRVLHDGEVRTIRVRPEYDAENKRNLIGFSYGSAPEELGLGGSVDEAADRMWFITSRTVTVFANLVDAEKRKEVSGVVGTSEVAHQTIDKFGTTEPCSCSRSSASRWG